MMSILCPFPLMNDFLESFYTLIPPKIGRDSCTLIMVLHIKYFGNEKGQILVEFWEGMTKKLNWQRPL